MPTQTDAYNMAVVRDLLLAAFTADDLRRLVLYTSRPVLKPLHHDFSSGDGLSAMVEKTTTFCAKHECLPDLLAEVKQANPRQYARFEGQLLSVGGAVDASSTFAVPPVTASGGTTYITHIQHAQGLAIGNGAQVLISSESDRKSKSDEKDQ